MLEWIGTVAGFLVGVAGFVAVGVWLFLRLNPAVDPLQGDPLAKKLKRKLQYFDDWQYAHEVLSKIEDRDERGWYLSSLADVLKDWDDRAFMARRSSRPSSRWGSRATSPIER